MSLTELKTNSLKISRRDFLKLLAGASTLFLPSCRKNEQENIEITINTKCTTSLSFCQINNYTPSTIIINYPIFEFINIEFLDELNLEERPAENLKISILPDSYLINQNSDFQIQVGKIYSENKYLNIGIGKYLELMENNSKNIESVVYSSRALSYLFLLGLARIGELEGIYNKENIKEISNLYLGSMWSRNSDLLLAHFPYIYFEKKKV